MPPSFFMPSSEKRIDISYSLEGANHGLPQTVQLVGVGIVVVVVLLLLFGLLVKQVHKKR